MQLAGQQPAPPFAEGVGDVVRPEFQLSMVGQVALRKEVFLLQVSEVTDTLNFPQDPKPSLKKFFFKQFFAPAQ